MNLYAQSNFAVVRQIGNHTDVTSYYVRAVIRNAYTDELIATLDLEDKGNQRYKKNWKVPADPSGEGFYVSIITSVYTDSGHTTKSDEYADEETTYLVADKQALKNGSSSSGIGRGAGLIGRDVRDIIVEELTKFWEKNKPKDIEFPKPEKYAMRWDDILSAVKEVNKNIKGIKLEPTDLKPIIKAISGIEKLVKAIEIPKLDLTPVIKKMEQLKQMGNEESGSDKEEILGVINALIEKFDKNLRDQIEDALKDMKFITSSVTFLGDQGIPAMHERNMGLDKPEPKKEEKETEEPIVDISKLAQ